MSSATKVMGLVFARKVSPPNLTAAQSTPTEGPIITSRPGNGYLLRSLTRSFGSSFPEGKNLMPVFFTAPMTKGNLPPAGFLPCARNILTCGRGAAHGAAPRFWFLCSLCRGKNIISYFFKTVFKSRKHLGKGRVLHLVFGQAVRLERAVAPHVGTYLPCKTPLFVEGRVVEHVVRPYQTAFA